MNHMEHVRALRTDTQNHYNCCQSVIMPFAQEMGLTPEQAQALGSHFGSGMLHGATCGALSIVECDHFCDLGEIAPDQVEVPGMFIDMILV